MFSNCIHCSADFGRNDAFEIFPVGSRLAFDPARGRLWVVCCRCDRWNLSPLDERWEAVEAAERRFRESRLRVSTDNIGLARLKEGVDLIRIGEPQRPEMAAWRYGDTFGRRRKRQMLVAGTVIGSTAAVIGGMVSIGVGVGGLLSIGSHTRFWDTLLHGRPGAVVARVPDPNGKLLTVTRVLARMSVLEKSEGLDQLWLRLRHTNGELMLHGDDALRATAQLLPTVNRFGGSRETVQRAVTMLEEAGGSAEGIRRVQQGFGARHALPVQRTERPFVGEWVQMNSGPGVLHTLLPHARLALEMALHEESERRAMEGELHLLEAAWRDAEVIAKISDDMFVSTDIDARVDAMKSADAPAS